MTQTPVLVGVAQLEQRVTELHSAKEPIELMIEAVQMAALDAECPALLRGATSVRVIRGMWPYGNPARAVADAVGANGVETAIAPFGGNFVQSVVNLSALEIQRGEHDIIIITGAECGNTSAKARRAGIELTWQDLPGEPDRRIGVQKLLRHEAEKAAHIGRPIQVYPMLENALRHHRGETIEAHLVRISELWAGFSAVAATNPHAWIRKAKSAEEIRTPSKLNRPVSVPYPKFMNSNSNVDQGAALIMCSTEKARSLGIDKSRWIYPWTGTDAHDHYYLSNRDNFYSSPAIRLAAARCLELANLNVTDLDLVDLYSCFPVAVQVSAQEIGLDLNRPLTVTGGLTFAGGPMNNYVMHSIARMVELLRASPEAKGLITANGGFITKHAFGLYSATEPAQPFQHADLQDELEDMPKREAVLAYTGRAEVESYTVMYGPEGPTVGHVSALLPDGRRAWANVRDPEVIGSMTREEFCGRQVKLADYEATF